MFSLTWNSFAFVLVIAVVTAKDFSFTIHNDASVGNYEGLVHTWLSIDGPGKEVKYFSFSNAKGANPLKPAPGISTVDDKLKRRTSTESFTAKISEEKYNQLSSAMDTFYAGTPLYQLVPSGGNTYNCVTASNYVLKSAGIRTLEGFIDPINLGMKLMTWKSFWKRCISPNWITIFGPMMIPAACVSM